MMDTFKHKLKKWTANHKKQLGLLLIHAHTITLLLLLVKMGIDYTIGNTGTYIYLGNIILAIVTDLTLFVAFTILTLLSLYIFYMLIWRMIFKDYLRTTNNIDSREGRVYYVQKQGNEIIIWANFKSFFNIFFPLKKLTRVKGLTMNDITPINPWQYSITENGHRAITSRYDMVIKSGTMERVRTDVEMSRHILDINIQALGNDTTRAYEANPDIISQRLVNSTYIFSQTEKDKFPEKSEKQTYPHPKDYMTENQWAHLENVDQDTAVKLCNDIIKHIQSLKDPRATREG